MEIIIKKIEQLNQYLEQNPNSDKAHLGKMSRYWLMAHMNPMKNKSYLEHALLQLQELYANDPANISLQIMMIQLLIDSDQFEEASTFLKDLGKYKKFFVAEAPYFAGTIAYFEILLHFYGVRRFGIKQANKLLDECISVSNEDPLLLCLKGRIMSLIEEDFQGALELYKKAFLKEYRSPILYLDVCSLYMKDPSLIKHISEFEQQVIRWGIRYNMVSREIINQFATWMIQFNQLPKISSHHFETIYQRWNSPQILHGLCMLYIAEGKVHQKALRIYQKVWENRFYIHKLEMMYVNAAWKQEEEDLPEQVIQHAILSEEIPEHLKSFLYHILLQHHTKYKNLLQNSYNDIIEFGQYSLHNRKRGRYYGTIYYELLKKQKYTPDQEPELVEQLFLYEVHANAPFVKYVWVTEKEKKRMEICNISESVGYFHGVSDAFQIYCVGNRQQTFYSSTYITATKLLPYIDVDVLLNLYQKGYESLELCIYLGMIYMDKENLTEQGEGILLRCLRDEGISDQFRKKISGRLGAFYVQQKELEKARKFFEALSPEEISQKQRHPYLVSMIYGGNIEEALKALSEMEEVPLTKEEKLYLMMQALDMNLGNRKIMSLAYELLKSGAYHEKLFDYLEKEFAGSQNEYYLLRDQFIFLGKSPEYLNERILYNGIWTQSFSNELEEVFHGVYAIYKNQELIKQFADYCAWEIMIHKVNIQRQTLHILEDLFLQDDTCYEYGIAILYVYAVQQVRTSNDKIIIEKVVSWMEKNQILFPWMKFLEDKCDFSSYIDKNVSFVHQSRSENTVYLWYRLSNEQEYHKKKMRYIGFGLYGGILSMFYDENIEYYVQDINSNGEETTSSMSQYHHTVMKQEEDPKSEFDHINNGVIYECLHQYEQLEQLIEQMIIQRDMSGLQAYLL